MSVYIEKLGPAEAQSLITEWQSAVDDLLRDVRTWVEERHGPDWRIDISFSDVEEEALGRYQIPVMEINTTEGRLVLEPVARWVIGGMGRIDMYAWPSLFRVMLLRRSVSAEWVIRTDSGINWPQTWGKDTFFGLAESLLKAA